MLIITNNEQDNPDLPAWKVIQDQRKVRRVTQGMSPRFVLGQEFAEGADDAAMRAAFGPRFTYLHTERATPIAVPPSFRVLDHGWDMAHRGIAGVTPTRGPSWCIAESRRRKRLDPIGIINVHAINRKPNRPDLWNLNWRAVQHRALTMAGKGLTVFIAGDWNDANPRKIASNQRHIVKSVNDHIHVIPGSVKVKVLGAGSIPLWSDHDARWAEFRLTAR